MAVPDVSVILPTRDRSRQLARALGSALAQLDVTLEVLIVDDGSTDDTDRILSRISDPRVRRRRNAAPEGVSMARNVAISDARGRWIAFLDDDDVWAPTKLASQMDVMRTSGRTWSYAGEVIVDEHLNVLAGAPPPPPGEVVRLLARYNAVPAGASNVVVAAEALAAAGAFDPALTSSEDWDMWIRLSRDGPPDWVRSPLVAISYHRGNASRDMDAMIRQLEVVARRYGIPVDRARHYRWAAWQALLEGRRAAATRSYARAVAAGDLRSLARAAVAIVDPDYALRRARKNHRAAEHEPWIAEARAWLEPLKAVAHIG